MPGRIDLSAVIPAYNSAGLIEATVARLVDRLADRSAEIIVVENGSTDDTLDRSRRLEDKHRSASVTVCVIQSEKGMGNALRAGILASRGDWVLLTADDLPFGFDDLDAADRLATEGRQPELIIGSKAHPDSHVGRGPTRGLLTGGFGILRRIILGSRVGDSQGTLLLAGELARRLAPELGEPGFLLSTEIIHLAERDGIAPVEVPVTLSADHGDHASRVAFSEVWRMGIGLVRLRLRHRSHSRAASVNPEARTGS